ncbi:hypothetical protein LINPERHAP1_LOCUS39481 [Linum perenne]
MAQAEVALRISEDVSSSAGGEPLRRDESAADWGQFDQERVLVGDDDGGFEIEDDVAWGAGELAERRANT